MSPKGQSVIILPYSESPTKEDKNDAFGRQINNRCSKKILKSRTQNHPTSTKKKKDIKTLISSFCVF